MQKAYYEGPTDPEHIVGNYAWHENFPYETLLLYVDGDIRRPLFSSFKGLKALDFACGPGRMVSRMSRFFPRVDGADISEKLITIARKNCPQSDFWVTSGADLGDVPKNNYDFIYSTIALQHIAVHQIRDRIFRSMKERLRPEGKVTLQMAYSSTHPYMPTRRDYSLELGPAKVKLSRKVRNHARWLENKDQAQVTNSLCDVMILPEDLPVIRQEFSSIFGSCQFWLYEVASRFTPPFGPRHRVPYWPTHWIFIHAGAHLDK